jgi:hypothetical protein
MKKFLIFLILLIFSIPAYAGTIYKWVDKDGGVNFTDDYDRVPPLYRDQVQKEEVVDVPKAAPPNPSVQTPPTRGEEGEVDIYGRDETWWRDKVLPWKEKLNEATANYEKARDEFMEKSEELSEKRFGSPTQYKMNIIELDGLKEKMKNYEAQMNEAKEQLQKLSKEAQESKADPSWLD